MFEILDKSDLFKEGDSDCNRVTVVQVGTDWCNFCSRVTPIIDELDHDYRDKNVVFSLLDVDTQQEIAEELDIYSIPTTCFFVGDKLVERIIGAHERKVYEDALLKCLLGNTEIIEKDDENVVVDESTIELVDDNKKKNPSNR